MIRFEDSQEGKPLMFYDKEVVWQEGKPIPKGGPTRYIEYDPTMPLTMEIQYFLDHLNNSPVGIADVQNAIEVMQILEMTTKSLERE